MCERERITPEEDYRKSNIAIINLLFVDRKEREKILLQLTICVSGLDAWRRAAGAGQRAAGAGLIKSRLQDLSNLA